MKRTAFHPPPWIASPYRSVCMNYVPTSREASIRAHGVPRTTGAATPSSIHSTRRRTLSGRARMKAGRRYSAVVCLGAILFTLSACGEGIRAVEPSDAYLQEVAPFLSQIDMSQTEMLALGRAICQDLEMLQARSGDPYDVVRLLDEALAGASKVVWGSAVDKLCPELAGFVAPLNNPFVRPSG